MIYRRTIVLAALTSALASAVAMAACGSDSGSNNSGGGKNTGGSASTTHPHAGGGGSTSTPSTGGSAGTGGSGGADSGPPDPCDTALFCDKFDSYAGVTTITDNQKFGPWHASVKPGGTLELDGTHTTSGKFALHAHIDKGATSTGGRLFSDGAFPLFMAKPTHVYGRMMMYIDPNGTSVHWTFAGVSGDAQAPENGHNAQYIMSSLPKNNVNTYSFVYGLSAQEGYHDCSSQSTTSMPTAAWSCISFELDSVARKLRMYKDGAAAPILSIDDHGNGCVQPTNPTDPWYGPTVAQLFAGAWTFHDMNDDLDVWIDDFVVDDKPVSCPAP